MKERGILFRDDMVRALLDGAKTETRRLVNPQPIVDVDVVHTATRANDGSACFTARNGKGKAVSVFARKAKHTGPTSDIVCPFGGCGTHLWVREVFAVVKGAGPLVTFRSDGRTIMMDDTYRDFGFGTKPLRWTSSLLMPRWASRTTLEVTSVSAERLQDIDEKGAVAEGFERREHFIKTIDEINGAGTFDRNPLVWVVRFRPLNLVKKTNPGALPPAKEDR